MKHLIAIIKNSYCKFFAKTERDIILEIYCIFGLLILNRYLNYDFPIDSGV